jgi:predicted porin
MKMKRNLIALAVGSASSVAMVAPAMAGDVTVYGRAQVELSSVSYEDEATASAVTGSTVEDGIDMVDNSMGRIGFKASEDLGNGWKGLAKFEFKTDTADNDTGSKVSLAPRESMVGLKGSQVQIELGNLKSAYKYAGGVKYDPFVASTLEARGNFGMTGKVGDLLNLVSGTNFFGQANDFGHNSFVDNHLGIQGGSGPIKARLTYGPEEGDGSYTLSVMFKQNNIEAFVAAVDMGDKLDQGTFTPTYDATKFGGQFKTGPHKISAQYEMATGEDDQGGKLEWTNLYVDYQMKMGKNTFDVAIGQEDYDDCNGDGCTPSFLRIGVIHKFTKMTRVFGGYRSSDSDGADYREDVVSIGLRKDF